MKGRNLLIKEDILMKNADEEQFQIRLASKADLNEIQLENKPFLFHAILKDDSDFVQFLLDEEIDLDTKYQIETYVFRPFEYSDYLNRVRISSQIRAKMDAPPIENRWLKCLESLNVDRINEFKAKFKNLPNSQELLDLGLVKSADLGSNKLIDYFLGLNVDVNCLCIFNKLKVTPLLQAIASKKRETAKYLIFRKADIHKKGEFGDALVTAVHYESPNDLITTILEKGASLSSRHRDWPNLNLREYCVQSNRVQAKSAIDAFVFRLIASGEYEKLKNLYENGYSSINVTNRFRKTGRDLAIERNHYNIVQLIDTIEARERRIRTKMGY